MQWRGKRDRETGKEVGGRKTEREILLPYVLDLHYKPWIDTKAGMAK